MKDQPERGAMIYVVATPIGNLEDISARALRVLGEVDVIACEDTRVSSRLVNHYDIDTPLTSLHDHNERAKVDALLNRVEQGESIALISDAGTPLVSDPGFVLVRDAIKRGIRLEPLPGACALIAAICVSGLATDRFCFEGFLPPKAQARDTRLEQLATEQRTMVFYESPRRVAATLGAMVTVFGSGRRACVAREITKKFEQVERGVLEDLVVKVRALGERPRGEFVLLVEGHEGAEQQVDDQALGRLLEVLPMREAVDLVVKLTGARRNSVYERARQLSD